MQQPAKKLTPERTLEVADSLSKEANEKKGLGNMNRKIAEAYIKKGKGEERMTVRKLGGFIEQGLSANERLEKSKRDLEESARDSSNAARYRKLALKAMTKNK